ncbi:Mor transcription activator family protein [Romboutsia lituseburensis]|uniref:Mor transcription activator family protein n=1 Tax=Romboutsia lituseburensis TaxID=1537 RepID=UPI00215B4472|nr:Mor transcription activator family protein [Romboutsia lituseburensis]MCR8743720.1 DNA-binding protein [Romboutsia lituseburensis]
MLEELTYEQLPDSLKDIADAIGLQSLKNLIKLAGGSTIYIPSEKKLTKPVRDKMIRSSFNGDYKRLSRKFNMTEVQIRNIIKSSTI